MFLVAVNTFLHYLLHAVDLRSEDPWENKTIYMRYVDIVIGGFNIRTIVFVTSHSVLLVRTPVFIDIILRTLIKAYV